MHEYAGSQSTPHTALTAFVLSAEAAAVHALTTACLDPELGHDHPLTQRLRDLEQTIYEIRLAAIKRYKNADT